MTHRPVLTALAVVLLAFSPLAPATLAAPATAADAPTDCVPNAKPTADTADLSGTVEYITGNQLRVSYTTDGETPEFSVHLHGKERVEDAHGFSNTSDGWAWDGTTQNPTITYSGASVSSDDWGAGAFPTPDHTGATVNLTAQTGIVSRELMYVGGSYAVTTIGNGCEEIRIVAPCGVNVDETVADVADSLRAASENLHAGNRWETTTVFAVEDVRSFGLLGVYFGEGDTAVRADLDVDDPGNTWVHEYIHARQGFTLAENMTWFSEGSAEYYAARLTLNQHLITTEDYNSHVGDGVNSGTVLSRPDTWGEMDEYQKGAVVLAALDERIREATDGEQSLEVVFRRMNAHDGAVNYSDFREMVADVAGEDVARWTDKYVTTTNTPEYHHDSKQSRSVFRYHYARALDTVDEWMEFADRLWSPDGECSRTGYLI